MEITVLGCWGPYPPAGGACSGYLIHSDETQVLLDCGHGVFSNMQKYTDFWKLDGVVLTHLHPDHCGDIPCLRHAVAYALKTGKRKEKLKVYLPYNPQPDFMLLEKARDAFDLINLENLSQFRIGQVEFHPFRTRHLISTYGLVMWEKEVKYVYTSDTGWFEQLPDIVNEASLLICEASLQKKDPEVIKTAHLTAHEAGRLAFQSGAKRLMITHFFPEYDLKLTEREAKEGFKQNIILAKEGLTIR